MLFRQIPSPKVLFVFEAAARLGSFSAAAVELNVTQPAISRMIKLLETELEVRLFTRSRTGLTLSEEGEILRNAVVSGFSTISQAIQEIEERKEDKEIVTLSVSTSFVNHWFTPRFEQFYKTFPQIDLRFQLVPGEAVGSVSDVDLGLRLEVTNHQKVRRWPFCDELVIPVASPHYVEEFGTLNDNRSHNHHSFLVLSTQRYSFQDYFADAGIPPIQPKRKVELPDYSVILHGTLNGQGIALGWMSAISPLLLSGALVFADQHMVSTGRHYHLVRDSNKPDRPLVNTIREWLIAEMEHDLEQLAGTTGLNNREQKD